MGFYWLQQKVEDENAFLREMKQRLTDIYKQEWYSSIQESSSNRLFKHLKNNFAFEDYLNMPNKYLRVSITKIRLSSHLLNVERGRWKKMALTERTCDFCHVIEDEFHAFIECPRYKRVRDLYLPHKLAIRPSMFSLISLLKCKNSIDLIKVGKLCAGVQKEHRLYL